MNLLEIDERGELTLSLPNSTQTVRFQPGNYKLKYVLDQVTNGPGPAVQVRSHVQVEAWLWLKGDGISVQRFILIDIFPDGTVRVYE